MLEIFLLVACLLFCHAFVRIGIPENKITISESFLLGHWFFIIINAVLVYQEYGFDWALLIYQDGIYQLGTILVIVGLLSFLAGTYVVADSKKEVSPAFFSGVSSDSYLVIAIVLVIIGVYAGFNSVNDVGIGESILEGRSPLWINISYLTYSAISIGLVIFLSTGKNSIEKMIGLLLILAIIPAFYFTWTRRPILGVAYVLIVFLFSRHSAALERSIWWKVIPVIVVSAVILQTTRIAVFFKREITDSAEVYTGYLDRLWLDSAGFSTFLYSLVIEQNVAKLWGDSILAGFVFWIPRSIYPDKPVSFDLSSYIGGLDYNLPASLYGEILLNFGYIGIPIFMFILGVVLKMMDIRFYAKPRDNFEVVFYLIIGFYMMFLVRGSFSIMFSTAIIVAIIPYVIHFILHEVLGNGRK